MHLGALQCRQRVFVHGELAYEEEQRASMYEEIKERLHGSIAPVITPFTEDCEIDFATQTKLIEWQLQNGTHAISVCGTTGEPSSLAEQERLSVMENAIKTVNGRVPVVPGTGSVNQDETLRLTRSAQDMGATAALVIVPYYICPNQKALFNHYKKVADSVDIPIIIYNIPGRTGTNMAPETMKALAEACGNIIGVKEANKDFIHINHVMQLCGRDFLLYSGIEVLCWPILAIGGAGFVSATANVAPREVAKLYETWKRGDTEACIQQHYGLMELNDVLFRDTNPVPIKHALSLMGMAGSTVRPPLGPLSEKTAAEVETTIRRYKRI